MQILYREGLTRPWAECIISAHMTQSDPPSLPTGRDGSLGGIKATTKLRQHGFEPQRNRQRVRPTPSTPTVQRIAWIEWLTTERGYDFNGDEPVHDPHDIAPEDSFEKWKGLQALKFLKERT